MFSLTVVYAAGNTSLFLYKEAAEAEKYRDVIEPRIGQPGTVKVVDDYGQEGAFNTASVHAVLVQDAAKAREAKMLMARERFAEQYPKAAARAGA